MPKKRAVKPVEKPSKIDRALAQAELMSNPREAIGVEFQHTRIDRSDEYTTEIGSVKGPIKSCGKDTWSTRSKYSDYKMKHSRRG